MLSGLKIVEIAGIGPGPFCAMHLADLGADVIVVDRSGGSAAGMPVLERYPMNRGKRSIVVDLKTAEGRERVLRLVDGADALIEGMRPGAMERLGLGPETCLSRNPRLIYGRMTGWGQSGPMARAAGHDNNYTALSGALYYTGTQGEAPSSPITLLGDVGGGALYLALGILAGVLNARATGTGTVVDASIVDGSAHMLQLILASRKRGLVTGARGENVHDSSHFYATYRCADGEHVTVGSIEPQFYALLVEKLGLQEDARFAKQWDRDRWSELREALQQIFLTKTRDEWCELLENTDVCFAPVLSPDEASEHPHMAARQVFVESQGHLQTRPAPRFDGEVKEPGYIPRKGEHTDELTKLLDEGDIPSVWSQKN